MARAWQQPFLNVFRHFKVDEWKRSTKEGDVSVVTDKTLKGSVYRIRGAVSASNYLQLPKISTQSLGLTGRYLYLLFRPLPTKHFVIHLDVSTEDNQVIRVSFSNLFKEFKSTATWLQFPFICQAQPSRPDSAPPSTRWTCLQLDLQDILLVYLNRRFGHLKSVRLGASLLVRNLYTSDLCFNPAVTTSEARRDKLAVTPMPREMAFPVPKGERWHDRYAHIRFPSENPREPWDPGLKSGLAPDSGLPRPMTQYRPRVAAGSKALQGDLCTVVQPPSPPAPCQASSMPGPRPQVSPLCRLPATVAQPGCGDGIHVFARSLDVAPVVLEDAGVPKVVHRKQSRQEAPPSKKSPQRRSFLPDPVLRLRGVIGFGGHSTRWALWTKDGASVVYPCHAVIVALQLETSKQRFFLGHTAKVSALALDGRDSLLASAQAQPQSMVWLWDFPTGGCLSMFRSSIHSVSILSFSASGAVLCGVGKDGHGKTMVVAWGTDRVGRDGEVAVLAKVHTNVDIQSWAVATDDIRMASCGQRSVRLWRLRGGALHSSSVNLGEHHGLHFTDLTFDCRADRPHTLYVCSRSGHILEVGIQDMAVLHARRLLPTQPSGSPHLEKPTFTSGPGVAISSLSVSQATCAVGSEDGYLRLWPLDFSAVLLEAEHEGPVSSVCVSPDGLRVLSTTITGHLGFLDVASREYCVLVRSHTASLLACATGPSRQLATVARDNTICIWDLATLQQLYELRPPEESPSAVAFHPTQQILFCGFHSGAVRSVSLATGGALVEHRRHGGAITGLATTLDGRFLFSTCSQGVLTQYDCAGPRCSVLRVAGNMTCQEARPNPNTLAVSRDSHLLAIVGPSKYTVTILGTASLYELLRVDVSSLEPTGSPLDSPVAVLFGPPPASHLLVSISAAKVLVLDTQSGRTIQELSSVHPVACSTLALSQDAQFLVTAGNRAIKVWDSPLQEHPGCQVFIGHSEPVLDLAFTPDQRQLLSVGDTIFLWDILSPSERRPRDSDRSTAWEAGPGAGQQEDVTSGAQGFPRCQVPMPSQAPPPQRATEASTPDSSDGVPSVSDEEGRSEEEPPSEPPQTPDLRGLLEKGAGGDRPRKGPGAEPTCPSSRPAGAGSPGAVYVPPITCPDTYTHFVASFKTSQHPKSMSLPPAGMEQLCLKGVVGYNGNGRANMVWRPDTGFFAYSCGCLLVVEDLHSGSQKHWLGHPEEVSTMALSHNAQALASASVRGRSAAHCEIRVWDTFTGACRGLISHHDSAVQALAFSPDDKLLVTLGNFADCTLALWSMATYQLVTSTRLLEPVHGVAFGPGEAAQFACVGRGATTFWFLQQQGPDICLQAHQEPLPAEVGACELTSLCFGPPPLLYCGSSTGQVCVWDTLSGGCFLTWAADDGEIGVLVGSESRLVSGSNTRQLRLWAVGAMPELRLKGSGARSSTVVLEHQVTLDGAVVSAAFDSRMDMGIVGTTVGTLWYINWAQGASTRLVSGHQSKVNEVAFSPDESHWATCGEDGSVRVWSLVSMELAIQFQVLNQSCLCLAWSPLPCRQQGPQRLVAGYSDGTLRVFSVSRTELELKMRPHPCALTAVAFSADGQTVLSGDKEGLVAVSHPRTGMTIRVLRDQQGAPICAIQSRCKEHRDFGVPGTDLWLAASGDQRVSVWAADWQEDICELVDWLSFPAPVPTQPGTPPPPSLAVFCPWDADLMVCAGFGPHPQLLLYSLRQKQVLETIPLPLFAASLSPCPGSHLVAVGFAERLLRLVDCTSGTGQDFEGHNDEVHLCRFSPSSRLLFTASHKEILVWTVSATRGVGRATSRDGP